MLCNLITVSQRLEALKRTAREYNINYACPMEQRKAYCACAYKRGWPGHSNFNMAATFETQRKTEETTQSVYGSSSANERIYGQLRGAINGHSTRSALNLRFRVKQRRIMDNVGSIVPVCEIKVRNEPWKHGDIQNNATDDGRILQAPSTNICLAFEEVLP